MSARRSRVGTVRSGSPMTLLSVISRMSLCAGRPGLDEGHRDLVGQGGVHDVAGREVDGDRQVEAGVLPARHCRSALASTDAVSCSMRPVDSASGMNTSGGAGRSVGCVQRTSASTLVTDVEREVELGLVVQLELVALEREVQVARAGRAGRRGRRRARRCTR